MKSSCLVASLAAVISVSCSSSDEPSSRFSGDAAGFAEAWSGCRNIEQGFGNRATFVIDKEGIIRHIDEGSAAIDPASAAEACNILTHKKAAQ